MTANTLEEQLTKYLTDAHSIEQQALAQMRSAPGLAGDAAIASAFTAHLAETEGHEHLVRGQLEVLGAKPAVLKDLVGTLTGKGLVAFAKAQPDTPGKLVAHAFSYEHMEEAAYELLGRVAERAGDEQTVDVARRIEGEERAMGDRLAGLFDQAAEASLHELDPDDLGDQLDKYLADAHAIEAQALKLLEKGPALAGTATIAAAYADHRVETEEHQRLIEARMDSRGESPSKIKDAVLSVGALNWGAFFQAQPDTSAKLAAFAYAFEHLEIAAYELLLRVARRAGDGETEQVTQRILAQEREAADRIRSLFEQALDASLQGQPAAAV